MGRVEQGREGPRRYHRVVPPVTSTDPSGVNAIADTALKCAGHVRRSLPVAHSHTYAAPVRDPPTKNAPSGEDATTPMGSPTKNLCSADSLSSPHTSSAFFDTCALTASGGRERTGGSVGEGTERGEDAEPVKGDEICRRSASRRRGGWVGGSRRALTEVVFAELAQPAAAARRRPGAWRGWSRRSVGSDTVGAGAASPCAHRRGSSAARRGGKKTGEARRTCTP